MKAMITRACLLAGTITCLSINPAVAAEWAKVSTDTDGTVVSIDTSTIRVVEGKAQVWVKLDRSLVPNSPFPQANVLWTIDCGASTMTILSVTSYDAVGSVRASQTYPDAVHRYEPVDPDSSQATIKNLVCKA